MPLDKYDCGLVIALQEEFEGSSELDGFRKFFEVPSSESTTPYKDFFFSDHTGKRRRGVVCILQDMTPLSAYQQTRSLVEQHLPMLLINVGIAGALSSNLKLGDVVVAEAVQQYDHAAKAVPSTEHQFTLKWGGKTYKPSPRLFDKIKRLWISRPSLYQDWQRESARSLESGVPPEVQHALGPDQLGDPKKLSDGMIASGNIVGAAPAYRDRLLTANRNLLALEMESAGFLKACEEIAPAAQTVVLKGISDLADENKEKLERSSKDTIRAWAMSNALHIAAIVCRNIFDFQEDFPPSDQAATNVSVPDIRDEFLKWTVQKHFKKQHRDFAKSIPDTLASCDPLFRCLIKSITLKPDENIFDHFAALIETSDNPYPLKIAGKPGTGKTTLLTLLYLALYHRSKADPSKPIPLYINLKRYTSPERGQEEEWQPEVMVQDDLAWLKPILGDSSYTFVVLLDGIDEYVRYEERAEHEFLAIVTSCSSAKKVVGIGLNYLADKARFKRNLGYLNNPAREIRLEAINIDEGSKVAAFIHSFQSLRNVNSHDITLQISERARQFNLDSIDLLLLSMLIESLHSTHYANTHSLSAFFVHYCEDFLSKSGRRRQETLSDASKLAFEYTVTSNPVDLSHFTRLRAWKLLHLHPTIKDFLVAYHVVSIIREAGRQEQIHNLRDLDYVYPYSINRFSKDLINVSYETQFEVLSGVKRVYLEAGDNAKPHCFYLVGRLLHADACIEARKWLQQCKTELRKQYENATSHGLTSTQLLILRTVYISLSYLGDHASSDEYIRLLLHREDWNDINRGFHLEYYDDIIFEPGRMLSHRDTLGPFPKTFENLRERIDHHLDDRTYGLFNIEAFTLYSLAQHRHAHNRLDDGIRKNLLGFLPQLLKSTNLSGIMRPYLKMLKTNFGYTKFLPGQIAEVLVKLKDQPRAGWMDHKAKLPRVESVADHSMGAFILGLTFLPDTNPDLPTYDKQQILMTLLIHDLAESITGDVPFSKVTEETKAREREAYQYISVCGTYPGIATLEPYYELWLDFERGSTENAKIARDIDKLENLVQLYKYHTVTKIQDYDDWKEKLTSMIETTEGRRILDLLREYFEPTTGQGNLPLLLADKRRK
jgi:nucleoside phosphorylase/5'-deoxynucleotidase YfbR-like HD superfamily hydrolase